MSVDSPSVVDAGKAHVWRVGRAPDPMAFTDHQFAGNNRWDDCDKVFRTVYVGDSLYGCFVEVLAYARPDLNEDGSDPLAVIVEDPRDALEYPVPTAGALDPAWTLAKMVGEVLLSGSFVDVRMSDTIAALRERFVRFALALGFDDFDAAALKRADPRDLTQAVAHHLYTLVDADEETYVDGVRFASRHGDELTMWAVFERPGDDDVSARFERIESTRLVEADEPDLVRAMELHNLTWLES